MGSRADDSGCDDERDVRRLDRRFGRRMDRQVGLLVPLFTVWLGGSLLLVLIARQNPDVASELLLDPSYSAGYHWYTGLVSDLGVMGWTIGGTAAAFGWWLSRKGGRPGAARLFGGGALLTGYLVADDLLQLHAGVIQELVPLSKHVVELLIAGSAAAWLWFNQREIRRTRSMVLGAALVALATSILVDATSPESWSVVWEDGAKFLGILAWATYFVITAADVLRSIFEDRPVPTG